MLTIAAHCCDNLVGGSKIITIRDWQWKIQSAEETQGS